MYFLCWLIACIVSATIGLYSKDSFVRGKDFYNDIIVGHLGWSDTYKGGDALFTYFIISLFSLVFGLLILIFFKNFPHKFNLKSHLQKPISSELSGFLILISFFSLNVIFERGAAFQGYGFILIYIVAMILLKNLRSEGPEILAGKEKSIYKGSLSANYPVQGIRFKKLSNIKFHWSQYFTLLVFSFFSIIGFFSLFYYLSPSVKPLINKIDSRIILATLSLSIALILNINGKNIESLLVNRKFSRVLLWSQIGCPFLMLRFLGVRYHGAEGDFRFIPTLFTFALALFLGIIWLRDFIKKYQATHSEFKNSENASFFTCHLSVLFIACFIVFQFETSWLVLASNGFYGNDFQSGEAIVSWHQIVQMGKRIYIDQNPVYGAPAMAFGLSNKLFANGYYNYLWFGISMWRCIVAGLNSLLLCNLLGPLWSLVFGFSLNIWLDRYLLVPTTCLIFLVLKKQYPQKMLLIWSAMALLMMFQMIYYNATAGIALIPAFAVIFILDFWKERKNLKKSIRFDLDLITKNKVAFLLFALMVFMLPNFVGCLKNILWQGQVNKLSYSYTANLQSNFGGAPGWFLNYEWLHPNIKNYAYLCLKTWSPFLIVSIFLYILIGNLIFSKNRQSQNESITSATLWLPILALIWSSMMIPVISGAVDAQILTTRDGGVGMFFFSFFLLLYVSYQFVLSRNQRRHSIMLGLCLAVPVICTNHDPFGMQLTSDQLLQKSIFEILAGSDKIFLSNLSADSAFGPGYADRQKYSNTETLHHILNHLLEENETYVDLVNRQLYYFLLNKPSPSLYPIAFQNNGYTIQSQAIESYRKSLPPVVWIGPGDMFQMRSAGLGLLRITRFFLQQNYRFYQENGFMFLLRNDRAKKLGVSELTESGLDGLVRVFFTENLEKLPSSWGRSWSKLNSRFDSGNPFVFVEAHAGAKHSSWRQALTLAGDQENFLLIEFDRENGNESDVNWQIQFTAESQIEKEKKTVKSFTFTSNGTKALVPIGADPRWFYSKGPWEIQFMPVTERQEKIKVKSVMGFNLTH